LNGCQLSSISTLFSKFIHLPGEWPLPRLNWPQPARTYLNWLVNVPREEQFTSAVVIGELYKGAYRSKACDRHLSNIEKRIIPAITALPFDIGTAKVFGRIRAHLEEAGTILPDADLQIAATALGHDLVLVTGNLRHFKRIPQLKLNSILFDSRNNSD
jgi:tRNA(fMet)-specific endonuclease VapC